MTDIEAIIEDMADTFDKMKFQPINICNESKMRFKDWFENDIQMLKYEESRRDLLIENLTNENKKLKTENESLSKRTYKAETLLFILVHNQIMQKGQELGKTEKEICDMTIETISAMGAMVNFENVRNLIGDREINIKEKTQ